MNAIGTSRAQRRLWMFPAAIDRFLAMIALKRNGHYPRPINAFTRLCCRPRHNRSALRSYCPTIWRSRTQHRSPRPDLGEADVIVRKKDTNYGSWDELFIDAIIVVSQFRDTNTKQ